MTEPIDLEAARERKRRRPPPPPSDPQPLAPDTQAGVAARFAEHVAGRAIYVDEENGWLMYEDGAWRRDRRERAVQEAVAFLTGLRLAAVSRNDENGQKLMRALLTARGVESVLRLAQTHPVVRRLHEELDADRDVLNCENGTIDLRTGALRPHDPANLITRMAPARYEPETAAYDDFAKLLEHLAPDAEARAYLQRAIGYSVTGRVTEDAVFLLVGPGRCGKSSIIHAARGALGSYFAGAKMETFCVPLTAGGNQARSDLVRLRHGRLVAASEVKPGLQLDNALLKSLAGGEGEAFPFREVYGREFVARWIGKVWLVCNTEDVPRMRSEDDAFWERAKRIPVGTTVPAERRDTSLRVRLEHDPAARSAFLAWAVQGAISWYALGGLGAPPAVLSASSALRADMDQAGPFFDSRCAFHPDYRESRKALRAAYESWCEDAGEKPVGPKKLALSLRAAGIRAGIEINVDAKKRIGDKVLDAWGGVRLRTDEELEAAGVPKASAKPQGDLF